MERSQIIFCIFTILIYGTNVFSNRQKSRVYPNLETIPQTNFSCRGRPTGYYADIQAGCQVYHMCDTLSRQYSYLCPNQTLFNQKFMICDHWYIVNCSNAETFYDLNLKMHRKENKTKDSKLTVKFIKPIIKNTKKIPVPSKTPSILPIANLQSKQNITDIQKPNEKINDTKLIGQSLKVMNETEHHRTLVPGFSARGAGPIHFGNFTSNTSIPTHHNGQKLRPLFIKPIATGLNSLDDRDIANLAFISHQFNPLNHFKQSLKRKIISSVDNNAINLDTSEENGSKFQETTSELHPLKTFNPPIHSFQPGIPVVFTVPIFNFKKEEKRLIRKQELFTPLHMKKSTERMTNLISLTNNSGIAPHSLFISKINHKDFFIPSVDLTPPQVSNTLQEHIEENKIENDNKRTSKKHEHETMTMVFPKEKMSDNEKSEENGGTFSINPSCPHCHPAFLKPGKCIPCVRIR